MVDYLAADAHVTGIFILYFLLVVGVWIAGTFTVGTAGKEKLNRILVIVLLTLVGAPPLVFAIWFLLE